MNTERFKGWLSSSSQLVAASAQLAKKQAELATLNNVTLPRLFHAIGKRIIDSAKLPPDLAPHRDKIRELEAAISTRPVDPKPEPASGFAAKAKHLAQQAASKTAKATADAAATVKIQAAYVALGRQAIEKYGQKALPTDLREQYEIAMQRQGALADEIGGLKSAPGKGFVTPGRLAAFGVATCILLGFWTLRGAAGWLFSRPEYVAVAATAPRQESPVRSKTAINQTATADPDDEETDSSSPTIGARDPAVAELLGPISHHYTTFGYKDVLLGQTFAEIDSKRPLRWVKYDAPFVFADAPRSTHGFVFDDTDRLVCYKVRYPGGPDDYGAELRQIFGPPDKRIDNRSESFAKSASNTSTIRYTFPRTIVCVHFVKTANTFTATEMTEVVVLDRRYVEDLLAVSASARRKAIDWIAAASESLKGDEFGDEDVPSLSGCRKEAWETKNGKGVRFIDTDYEQDAGKPVHELFGVKGRVATVGLLDTGPNLPSTHEVFFNFAYFTPALIERPLLKKSNVEGQPQTPVYASKFLPEFWRLEAEMTASMLQQHFPPRDGKYQFMQRGEGGAVFGRGTYEWEHDQPDGGRWSIECGENDYVRLVYKPRKRL